MSLAASVLTAALALPQPGLVVAYDFARTNFLNWSEGPLASMIRGGTPAPTEAAGTDGYAAWFVFPAGAPSSGQYVYSSGLGLTPSTTYTISAVVRMDSGAAPVLGTSGDPNADMSMVLAGDAVTGANSVEALGGGLYRVSTRAATNATIGSANCGVVRYPGQSGRGFRITALSLRAQPGTAYERTTDGQLLLDRSVRLWPAPAARTNYANWSEDLTQSAWVRSQVAVSLVAATLADGTQGTVSRVVDNTNNTQHLVSTSTFLPPDNAPQSFAWRLKAAEYRYVGVQWANKAATAFPTTIVDLQDGVILNAGTGASMGTTITATSGGLAYTVTVAAAGNGWWDVTVAVPSVGAGANSPRPALLLHNSVTAANNYTFAGTGTSGVLVQRVQWNATPNPLPYERQTDGVTYDLSTRGRNLLFASETYGLMTDTYFTATRSGGTVTISMNNTSGAAINFTRQWFGSTGVNSQSGATMAVQPGRTYTLSALVRATGTFGGGNFHLGLHVFRNGAYANEPGVYASVASVAGGSRISMTYTIPVDGGTYVIAPRFVVYSVGVGGTGTVTLSEVQLEDGPAPTGYERSAGHSTLGSAAGADSNDPAWVPQGLSFDGVDDSTIAGAFSLPDGDLTFIHVFTPLVDSGTTDGKALTRTHNVAGQWRMSSYFGGLTAGGVTGMGWKAGLYHATGGFSNTGFTYFNVGLVAVNQARVGVIRVRGLTARAELLASATMPAVSQSQILPAVPVGGLFNGFGSTANAIQHGFYVWSRALSDAELAQAYRFIRAFNSRRGVSI